MSRSMDWFLFLRVTPTLGINRSDRLGTIRDRGSGQRSKRIQGVVSLFRIDWTKHGCGDYRRMHKSDASHYTMCTV